MRQVALFLLALLVLTPAYAETLTVAAPSSLNEVIKAIAADFTVKNGTTVTLSIAGTPALAKQVEAGAPVDVFISADEQWIDWLDQRHLVAPGSRREFAGNELVLIGIDTPLIDAPIDRTYDIAAALGADGRLAIAEPGSVPAGRYGKEALSALGLWDAVKERLAVAENVRGVLELVRRGEARLGVVYRSDVLVANGVPMIGLFPKDSHRPIVYAAVEISGHGSTAAREFMAFLVGDTARQRLVKAGFAVLCDGKPC